MIISTENLALQKPTFQSSTYAGPSPGIYGAGKAVDGNKNYNGYHGYCSITDATSNPSWWAVDLQQRYLVDTVIITNRGDCCGQFKHMLISKFNVTRYNTASNYISLLLTFRRVAVPHPHRNL